MTTAQRRAKETLEPLVAEGRSRMVMRACATLLILFYAATPAAAHSPMPGIEGFYVGLLDPVLAVPQVLVLLSLGLLIASLGNRQAVWPVSAFVAGTLAGIVLGAGLTALTLPLLAIAVLCGGMAAGVPGRFLALVALAAGVAGFLIGAVSIPDPGPTRDRIITVTGSFVGANIALLYVLGAALFIRERNASAWVGAVFRSVAGLICAMAIALVVFNSSGAL